MHNETTFCIKISIVASNITSKISCQPAQVGQGRWLLNWAVASLYLALHYTASLRGMRVAKCAFQPVDEAL